MESGEGTKLSWAAVVANKDKSCKTKEKKVEEEVKDPEEVSDLKQTEAGEEVLQKEEQVKEPEEVSGLKQTEAGEEVLLKEEQVKEPEEVSDLKQTEAGEEVPQEEKNRNKKKHERKREKALKAKGIIVNEMDNLANIVQSCETSEATDEKKEVEEFPYLPKTEAGQVGLQKMESGEERKRSWAAVLKDQSCKTKEKKVEEEVKEPEEVSDLKKTEAGEEVLLKEEQVKDPEEVSDLKQTPAEGKRLLIFYLTPRGGQQHAGCSPSTGRREEDNNTPAAHLLPDAERRTTTRRLLTFYRTPRGGQQHAGCSAVISHLMPRGGRLQLVCSSAAQEGNRSNAYLAAGHFVPVVDALKEV
ncbi:hypothetical protein F7725_005150 [Dissostichus mawsoni]|uniref:Uncharacterized protein n=1 Tax=Dissostichus mawsoni TaxID=36200 RepID=A0A7J5YQS9_DISMA|nr:hypothetical protein F7725_005150 [Dissostichus mawsoni]